MLEFINKSGEIKQAHQLTKNYNKPNLKELLFQGWKPIYYDIPEYDKDTHWVSDYKLIEKEDKVIAKAIIEEVNADEDDIEVSEYNTQ